jgi:hypothetical protein
MVTSPAMADEAEGGYDCDDVLAELLAMLSEIRDDTAHLRAQLDRAMPVIDAYLSPAASGPAAWAVRRQIKKGGQNA